MVEEKTFCMNNVISIKNIGLTDHYEKEFIKIKSMLLKHNLYSTSPVMFRQYHSDKNGDELEFMISLSQEIVLKENSTLTFTKELKYLRCVFARYLTSQMTNLDAENMINTYASQNGIELEKPYIYVVIPIPNGTLMDMVAGSGLRFIVAIFILFNMGCNQNIDEFNYCKMSEKKRKHKSLLPVSLIYFILVCSVLRHNINNVEWQEDSGWTAFNKEAERERQIWGKIDEISTQMFGRDHRSVSGEEWNSIKEISLTGRNQEYSFQWNGSFEVPVEKDFFWLQETKEKLYGNFSEAKKLEVDVDTFDTDILSYLPELEELICRGRMLTHNDLEIVAGRDLSSLDALVESGEGLEVLGNNQTISQLKLRYYKGDLSGLTGMKGLETLYLYDCIIEMESDGSNEGFSPQEQVRKIILIDTMVEPALLYRWFPAVEEVVTGSYSNY